MGELWTEVVQSTGGDLASDAPLAELLHENSKISHLGHALPDEAVVERMQEMWQSLPYDQYPAVDLPESLEATELPVHEAILARRSARDLWPSPMTLRQAATLLTYAYGETASNEGTFFPRPFRAVPSAGALFPLELYVHVLAVEELNPGLYHYNPSRRNLRLLHDGELTDEIASTLHEAQPNLAYGASVFVFVTAAFPRSTFKYGERGYRFILLEAGHVAQNLNLGALALGFASVDIGGFYDRDVDALLGLDGVTQSAVYLVAIGGEPASG